MLPTEQALSLLPPERFRLLPATQPEACTKTLNSYNYFCKFPVTPDTFGARICLSSFYACQEMCQEMCQEACQQKSPDTRPDGLFKLSSNKFRLSVTETAARKGHS